MRLLFALLALYAFAVSARAEPVRVPAAEIRDLLTGNTIRGTWSGDEYKQYCNADGSTIHTPRRPQSTAGKWRVNDKTNEYESWWERSGWGSGYNIVLRDGVYFWESGDTAEPQAFTIEAGQKLTPK